MRGLKERMIVANVARRSHSHASDQTRSQVREDVAEQVLGYEHIELFGSLQEI